MDAPKPLAEARRSNRCRDIRLLATDVDGTLTQGAVLQPRVVEAIAALCAAGIEVMPVSGRSAGEVLGLVRYLPGVRRGIAENGLVALAPDEPPLWLADQPDQAGVSALAIALAQELGLALVATADAMFRLGDVAFERGSLADEVLAELRDRAAARGLHVTWSNVHVHFTPEPPDKGRGVLRAVDVPLEQIATIGDAPNDAGLFVAGRFGLTVGTADVLVHRQVMPAMPEFVTEAAQAGGFLELAEALLQR